MSFTVAISIQAKKASITLKILGPKAQFRRFWNAEMYSYLAI